MFRRERMHKTCTNFEKAICDHIRHFDPRGGALLFWKGYYIDIFTDGKFDENTIPIEPWKSRRAQSRNCGSKGAWTWREFCIIMLFCVLIPSLNINYKLFSNGISTQNHIIMKNNIRKYIRSCPGMPAVVKCVAYKSKANVTADYENIKYYFRDQDPTGTSHWVTFAL